MTTTATDPRPLLRRTADQFAALVATVEPERLGDPTPCSEFDVRALISHVLGNTLAYAIITEGGPLEQATGGAGEIADEGWAAAYAAAAERLVAAGEGLDDPALEHVVDLGFAKMPLRGTLSAVVMEIAAHSWDLRTALDSAIELAPDVAEFSLAFARQAIAQDRRGGPVPFAPVRPAPEGADAYGQLAAWLGREVPSAS
ncbi:TIGR03086 family metal-binding protein [Streptomyces sp. NPDC041068]|uniref:TIGR03086 family metal-binding protein n=1 Tax=Streptomyces sp. NPDC041068 TaxID=3155130 RepID=UPI0033EE311C